MGNFVDRLPFSFDVSRDTLLETPSAVLSDAGFHPGHSHQSAEKKRLATVERKGLKKGVGVKTADGTRTNICEVCDNGEVKVEAFPQVRVNPMSLKLL